MARSKNLLSDRQAKLATEEIIGRNPTKKKSTRYMRNIVVLQIPNNFLRSFSL